MVPRLFAASGLGVAMLLAGATAAGSDFQAPALGATGPDRLLADATGWLRQQTHDTVDAYGQSRGWFGLSPRLSVFARDFSGVQRLAGGRVALTDDLRLWRSNRMVIARWAPVQADLRPYVQLGLGVYRVPSDVFGGPAPSTGASQGGVGVELRLGTRLFVGAEANGAFLYEELRLGQVPPFASQTAVLQTTAALRMRLD